MEDRALLTTVQFDFSTVFNQDSIRNRSGGTDDTTDTSIDNSSRLITEAYAIDKSASGNGLPDDGFFSSNAHHPDVQLGYNNDDDGNNVVFLPNPDDSVTVDVPDGNYHSIHVFAMGANGDTTMDVIFNYSDGGFRRRTNPEDWFNEVTDGSTNENATQYNLINGMDRFDLGFVDENDPAIFGFEFTGEGVDPTRLLQSITIENSSASSTPNLVVFGATGNNTELIVDTNSGANDGDFTPGNLSLPEAIEIANGRAGTDPIKLDTTGTITLDTTLTITDSVTIEGPGADELSVSGGGSVRVFNIDDADAGLIDVSISDLSIVDGEGQGFLAGGMVSLENTTLRRVSFVGNTSTNGGAGLGHSDGELVVDASTFSGNTGTQGGAIEILSGNVTITNTTVSGNSATGLGGGITVIAGSTTIRNSTIVENNSDSDDAGGETGGGLAGNAGLITMHNSIVAGNFRGSRSNAVANDVSASLVSSSSFNLIGDSGTAGGLTHGGANGNILGIDGSGIIDTTLVLDLTLADNGGPTQTHLLVSGGPAVDAGSNAEAKDESGADLTTDQRGTGFARVRNGTVDIGAVEMPIDFVGLLIVDTNSGANDGDFSTGNLSLPEAVAIANDRSGTDTITFNPLLTNSTITLAGDELVLTDDATISGLGASNLTIDAGGGSRVFRVMGAEVTISDIAITGGDADKSTDNDPGWEGLGGGIFNEEGTLTVLRSRLYGNLAQYGAGINNWRGTVTIDSSTFDGNQTTGGGAGLYNWGDGGTALATVTNSTFSGNTNGVDGTFTNWAGSAGSATLDATNVTIAQNTGAGVRLYDGPVTLNNSLVLGNSTGDLTGDPIEAASANNIIGDDDGVTTSDVINTTLSSSGFHSLPDGSPAINAGDDSLAVGSLDQRGQPRFSGTVDIGAFEKLMGAFDDTAGTTATTLVNVSVLTNDTPASGTGVVEITTDPGDGTAVVKSDGTIDYTPDAGFTGDDTFGYRLGLTQLELAYSGTDAQAEQGNAVAVDGDYAVVGVRGDNFRATLAGTAAVYKRSGAGWDFVQHLDPPDIAASDRAGYDVAISGTTIVVSSRMDDDQGLNSGSVYVWEFGSTGRFVNTDKLVDPSGKTKDQFGHSVAIDGDTIVVGARLDDGQGTNSGSVMIFERATSGWSFVKTVKATDAQGGDQFGFDVAIEGDTVVVGARKDDDSGTDSGSAYILERDVGGTDNWGQVAKLLSPTGRTNDWYAASVDISGDTVAIGKPIRNSRKRVGEVHIYERNNGGTDSWGLTTTTQSSNSANEDQYGYSVSLDSGKLAVGARRDDVAAGNSGTTYLHARDSGGDDSWGETDFFVAADAAQGDNFGSAVALEDNTLLIGAPAVGDNDGSAYIEDLRTKTATVTVTVTQNQLSGSGIGQGPVELLTRDQLEPVVTAAADWWRRTGQLSPQQLAALNTVSFDVASLDDSRLGFQSGGAITIDADAAGHGWYVDATPYDLNDDVIGRRMDLLSNVTHELGHVLGLEDQYDAGSSNDVMFGFLKLGDRSVPAPQSLDLVFAGMADTQDDPFGLWR